MLKTNKKNLTSFLQKNPLFEKNGNLRSGKNTHAKSFWEKNRQLARFTLFKKK
jgi:hypothetical protein